MKKILLALSLGTLLATGAYAQTPLGDLTGTGAVSYESQYVFRGKKLANSSIQPKAEIGLQPLSLPNTNLYIGAWSNQPVSPRQTTPVTIQHDEIDLYGGVYYNTPLNLALDVGGTYYWYPESAGAAPAPTKFGPTLSHTYEGYVGLLYNTAQWFSGVNLNPAVYYYHDFVLDQNVIEISAKTTWDLTNVVGFSGLSLEPRIFGGVLQANKAFGDTAGPNWKNGYVYYGAGMDLNYMISPYCYLFGNVNYAGNRDGKTGAPAIIGGDPQYGGTPNSVWFGAGLKFRK